AKNFVEKTYTQAESINRHQCGMTDSISEKLIRYREDLFLEAISLFRSREKWKDRPKAYTELLQIIHETLTYFEKEIRYNYYTLNHNITRPYLLQVQALIREISEEFPELVTVQWKCLLYGIELYLEEQLVAPYLQDIQDLQNGSEFERLLMHLHDNYFWRKKIEVLGDDVEWVLSFITDLDMREDTKRKMISMLKKPMNSWPEKYREIAKNLEAFYLRFRDL